MQVFFLGNRDYYKIICKLHPTLVQIIESYNYVSLTLTYLHYHEGNPNSIF